jgi:hypothetical protein
MLCPGRLSFNDARHLSRVTAEHVSLRTGPTAPPRVPELAVNQKSTGVDRLCLTGLWVRVVPTWRIAGTTRNSEGLRLTSLMLKSVTTATDSYICRYTMYIASMRKVVTGRIHPSYLPVRRKSTFLGQAAHQNINAAQFRNNFFSRITNIPLYLFPLVGNAR